MPDTITDLKRQLAELIEENKRLQAEISGLKDLATAANNFTAAYDKEALLRSVLDGIPQYIFWKDINYTFIGCNQSFARLAGVESPTEITGKTDAQLHWLTDIAELYQIEPQVIIEDTPFSFVQSYKRLDGLTGWLEINQIPLHDGHGQVVGVLGMGDDISEQRKAEELLKEYNESLQENIQANSRELALQNAELNQFKTVLDMTVDAVFLHDVETLKIIYVNRGASQQLGYSREALQNMHPLDIFYDFPASELEEILAPLRAGIQKATTFQPFQQSKDGAIIPVETTIQCIELGNQKRIFVTISRDVTERQQTELMLQEAMEATERARFEAQRANQAKSTFLANMSHELRTPLNGILGYTQILTRSKSLDKKQQDGINIIQRSGDYLLTLINDILDLAKIEAEKIELYQTGFHFGEFLQGITELFRMRAQQKGIDFIYEPLSDLPVAIHADEKRLRQVLINLLGNAVKFTDSGQVTFKVGYHQELIRFQVEDTGIGIATEDVKKIFLPFQQVGDQSYRAEGTGLGLPITQKLIEMMGGALNVESELGQGSIFWTALPLQELTRFEKTSDDAQADILGYEGRPRKILIVDDLLQNRRVLIELLKPLGFSLFEAENGQVGLAKLPTVKPDLVLLNIMMPVLDGLGMVKQIRADSAWHTLPVIAVSASVFDYQQQQALDAGCDGFLPKPVRAETLLELLAQHLQLTWIYDAPPVPVMDLGSATAAHSAQATAASGPSPEEAVVLYDLAMMGDIGGILEHVEQLEHDNTALAVFAHKVRQLAKNFEEEEICELVRQYMPESSEPT